MSSSAETQQVTLDKFIAGWKNWKAEDMIADWSDECTQTVLPFSLGHAPRTRAEVAFTLPKLMGIVSNHELTIHEVVHDFTRKKAVVYALSKGDTPFGVWRNEYAVFLSFSESGEQIIKFEEMLSLEDMTSKTLSTIEFAMAYECMIGQVEIGSTGNCGTALIKNLLRAHDAKIHAYCRNKDKLLRLLPEVSTSKTVEIFEGSINDIELLTFCIRDCRAVFLVVSTNDNIPSCRVGQDTAASVIRALQNLRSEVTTGSRMPKLVLLSSATIDDLLSRNTPSLLRSILLRSASNVYNDLRETEKLLRAQDEWVTTIFIKPGALAVDQQRGHALSLTEEESPVSYLDLAAAMIEAADDNEGRYDMRNVGVINTNGKASFPVGTPFCILMGILRHYFPFLHPYLPSTGP
ncbi:Monoogygenase [Hyphodiscus hymeniophilus]|uniref:Monoogygenase n=1 Tax=Hyphodiscus hymeniophilus TaxID=353542 RepID=A0A9P6VME0_9HELO|nr:Monoogygenase [Hyphodiscus hymeniophilus]